ncbi:MAG: hypothetical protein WBV94_22930 [Blastocatellia bacterium]
MTNTVSHKRLRYDRVEVYELSGEECRVKVFIALGDQIIEKYAINRNDAIGRLKAAAVATLKAIEESVDYRFTAALADLDHVNALGKDLIAVLVDVVFESKEVQVFGSCQIAGSELDAAVKSALNATNRFFELAMRA